METVHSQHSERSVRVECHHHIRRGCPSRRRLRLPIHHHRILHPLLVSSMPYLRPKHPVPSWSSCQRTGPAAVGSVDGGRLHGHYSLGCCGGCSAALQGIEDPRPLVGLGVVGLGGMLVEVDSKEQLAVADDVEVVTAGRSP